ncbi:MAG TPA: DNA internalization-related competence protein ComEC/Rec2 [Thermoanaerobaculia bacterium]
MIRPVLEEGEAPAARAALCVVAGVFAGAWSVRGAAEGVALLVVAAPSLAWLTARGDRSRRSAAARLASAALWLAAGFLAGRLRIAIPASEAPGALLRAGARGEFADSLEGVLADFWSGEPPRARTTLRAERILGPEGWLTFRAEVVVYLSGAPPASPLPDRGDRVRLTGRLEREDLPASDREIPLPWPRYRLSVKSARLVEPEGATLLSLLTLPNRALFRAATRAHGARDDGIRGPLAALLLGRTTELDRGMVARFRRGGLYHLLVVSGLHVLLAAGLVGFALERCRIDGKRRDAALLAAVALFVLIGGANPPAVRAGLVVGVFLLTRLLERPVTGAQAVGLSACALFLVAPGQVFSVGTVLTFAAVLGIASFAAGISTVLPKKPRWLFAGLAASLAAQCATAPVLLWRFNLVAAAAWLTAPLAIPLSAGLIALGGLVLALDALALPALAAPPAVLFRLGMSVLEWTADRAAGAAFLRPTPPLAGVLLVGALLVAAARTRGRIRAFAAAGAAGVFVFLALRPGPRGPAGGFAIEALDVGQGDAILLRWQDRAVLVDGGGPFDAVSTDFGRTRLVPKLLDRGITRLDAVLLTHPHPDHGLGLFAVLEELPVGSFLRGSGEDESDLYGRLDALAARRGVPVRVLADGDTLDLSGGRLFTLHSGGRRRKTDAVNNQSVVALFERGGRSALLTGDAGAPTEADLAASGALTPVDVLKVGHHGSRTSTSAALMEAARPRIALLSCGRRNRFGHPAADTLATLTRFCVPLLRTDLRSDCRIELEPGGTTRLRWRGTEGP